MTRPGLLGLLDARMERIRATCEEEGASVDQFAAWMTGGMAEVVRDASADDFAVSNAWLNRRRRGVPRTYRQWRKIGFGRRWSLRAALRRPRPDLYDDDWNTFT